MRKRIYIAGPISKGDMLHNVQQADTAFRDLLKAGFAPLCPHWSVFAGSAEYIHGNVFATASALPSGTTHEDWMMADLPWVQVADAVLRLPGESTGADMEVEFAQEHDVPVFHTIEDVLQWAMKS